VNKKDWLTSVPKRKNICPIMSHSLIKQMERHTMINLRIQDKIVTV